MSHFGGADFSAGQVLFSNATFAGGHLLFNGAAFSGGRVSFGGATFSDGSLAFFYARFSGGEVAFRDEFYGDATFSGGEVDLSEPQIWRTPPTGMGRADGVRWPSAEHLAGLSRERTPAVPGADATS